MGKKPRFDKNFNDKASNTAQDMNKQHSRSDNTFHDDCPETNRQRNTQTKYDYRQSQLDDSKDYSSFKVVLFYCSLIVLLPVVTFFMLKTFVLDSLLALGEVQGNIYAATGAIISLHIALGLYIYRAYFGTDPSPSDWKRKKLK